MKRNLLIATAFFLTLLAMAPHFASAYIMPTRTILQKASENAGSGIYAVEQEVQFNNGDDTIHLKETWLIENDHTMRLTVTGTKELQNGFKLQFLYAGGQRWSMANNTRKADKISETFLEKYLNFRAPESFANVLVHNKIIPSGSYNKKSVPKSAAEFKYEPESWVRLSRVGGATNYAFGTPTPADQEAANPGIWIEQDQFVVRKLRLTDQVEMTADNYNQFAKGLFYPRSRTIRWGNNTVNIRLISVAARPVSAVSFFQPNSLDTNLRTDGLEHLPAKEAILEFYSRYR